MDFSNLKKKALEFKDSAVKYGNETIDKTANKFKESSFVIKEKEELEKFISDNKNAVVIFGASETDFYKKSLITFPVLFTKGWANNFKLKMFDVVDKTFVEEKYKISELPTMHIYSVGELSESVVGDENIMKVVKNLNLDVEGVIK